MCGSCGGNKQANGAPVVAPREAPINYPQANEGYDPRPVHQHPCAEELKGLQQPYVDRVPCIGDYEQHLFETPEEDICDKGPREPYHIPGGISKYLFCSCIFFAGNQRVGLITDPTDTDVLTEGINYSGHVPTLQSRAGHTFGQDSHEVLASQQGYNTGSYNKNYHICPEPMHQPYRIPGYTGHVPGLKSMVGGTFGSDTHKLLYSVDSYPNRQENLSLYRPDLGSHYGGASENQSNGQSLGGYTTNGHPSNGATTNGYSHGPSSQAKQPHGGDATSSTYERPKEHYYKPQFKYRIADTYATRADITLVDPCINKESKVVVSTRELDDTQVVRTQDCLEERVEAVPYINKPIRHRPMVPGFDTFIDAMRGARGQRFEFSANTPDHQKLQQQLILRKGKVKDFPGSGSGNGNKNATNCPPGHGGSDELPYGYGKYGNRQRYTNSALYDFTSNYRRRMSSEWAPAGISRPDPPAFDIPGEIYNEHMGLLPGYSGEVPGAMYRCGKTFTDDSRDARRALRGDRV